MVDTHRSQWLPLPAVKPICTLPVVHVDPDLGRTSSVMRGLIRFPNGSTVVVTHIVLGVLLPKETLEIRFNIERVVVLIVGLVDGRITRAIAQLVVGLGFLLNRRLPLRIRRPTVHPRICISFIFHRSGAHEKLGTLLGLKIVAEFILVYFSPFPMRLHLGRRRSPTTCPFPLARFMP